MSLSDDEARQAYAAFVAMMRDVGLAWVVDQVEATIALGKPQRRRLASRDFPQTALDLVARRLAAKAGTKQELFTVVEQYTAAEQLSLMIDALRAAVIQANEFASAILNELGEASSTQAEFRSEVEGREGFRVEQSEALRALSASHELSTLLDELEDRKQDASPAKSPG